MESLSSGNPTHPVITPTSIASTDANPAITCAFLGGLLNSVKRALLGARPWMELIDRSAFSRPDSLSDATARLPKNLAYFRVNYAAIIALSHATVLLAHPFSLATLLTLLAAWETNGSLIAASSFVVFLTSTGSLIFSVLALGATLFCAHGAFCVSEDLFLNEPDQANSGASVNLLSFITNATRGRV
ncbi:hypothetical protein GUJ93_ZPchr0011g28795 [Zizania palustris]|uniref:PRA1 family protein n=1 Tax=Zizania palustris TaxID=103762 RepID=A0A8J6BNU9_ZIZPA|nr:hypothetical protein GUJ93_ZPchr0011g28795 [Zizania palustris]